MGEILDRNDMVGLIVRGFFLVIDSVHAEFVAVYFPLPFLLEIDLDED